MITLKKMVRVIDTFSKYAGLSARWLAWLLVLVGAYDTIMRHFFNAPTIWAYETMCMAGGALYALGWSYCYLYDSHVRVDLLYRLLPDRKNGLPPIIRTPS